ncbi:hypothetical protein [Enterovibrio coralii]|uniref:hypothetical protein n=1 Tax=Enterovibrio coralii TaxID=294935 RepID=UPI000AE189BF|nr:hypothetical protein [Enterovibrio coralii]
MFSKLKSVFSALMPSIRASLPILMFLLLVILIVAIWAVGSWLTVYDYRPLDTLGEKALTTAMLLLIWAAVWGVRQWRKLTIYQQKARREFELQEDPIKRFEEQQGTELNRVIDSLKEALGRKNYLYALPWYLFLGEENSGKTSLIHRSGQEFSFSSHLRGASKAKGSLPFNIDWWAGRESVVIDFGERDNARCVG